VLRDLVREFGPDVQ